jgi:hypothetical protein
VVLAYNLSNAGVNKTWTIDLKNGAGSVYEGAPKAPAKADVELTLAGTHLT